MKDNLAREVDVRGLSSTREFTVYTNGGLFPVLTVTHGGTLVAVLRGGAGHLGREGRIEVVRSLDRGCSWTPPAVIADSERDDRNPALGVSSQGTLILAYHRQGNYDEDGNYLQGEKSDPARVEVMVTRSRDEGLTWAEPQPLGVSSLSSASAYGKIVSRAGGTLLLALYGEDSWLVRSTDDGRSWGDPSRIAVRMTETALLVLPDGDLLALLRGGDSAQALHSARSSDGGYTWSAPQQVTGARQHPADLALLANGDVLLTYGNRNPPYRIEGRISQDGGRTWLPLLLTFSGHLYGYDATSRPTDLGYPSTAVVDGVGVTLYYYTPSMRRGVGISRAESPALYSPVDYRAIGMVWDEAECIAAVE